MPQPVSHYPPAVIYIFNISLSLQSLIETELIPDQIYNVGVLGLSVFRLHHVLRLLHRVTSREQNPDCVSGPERALKLHVPQQLQPSEVKDVLEDDRNLHKRFQSSHYY